jgi:hypothetical protein
VVASLLAAAGIGYRIWLIAAQVPPTDSDEATMGLDALHIIEGRGLPNFLAGQHYLGTVEAYLAAPFIAALGPTTTALRLPCLLLYAAFLSLMYRLVARVYTPWFAALTVGLLALGSDRVVKDQLIAHGRTPEIKPVAAGLLLIAVGLAGRRSWRRTLACTGWGLAAGLMLWVDWLILPYLGAALGVLLIRDRAGWARLGRDWLWLVGGFLTGVAPLIGYNLTADRGEDSLSVLLRAAGGPPASLASRLSGDVLWGVPLATGACRPGRCTPWEQAWGPAFLLLLAVAEYLAVAALRRTSPDPTRQYARLALVVGAGLTVLAYLHDPASGHTPVESARYLSCLPVCLPAVLWPLWRLATGRATTRPEAATGPQTAARPETATGPQTAARPETATGPQTAARPETAIRPETAARLGGLLLVAVAAVSLDATVALVRDAGTIGTAATRQDQLIRALDAAGVARLYSEYWTCDRLAYATRERIACAVVSVDLRRGADRYQPLADEVRAEPRPGYAFPAGSVTDAAFVDHLRDGGIRYAVTDVAGYHLYRVPGGAGVPLPDAPPRTDHHSPER